MKMKMKLFVIPFLCLAATAQGTVTLQFSDTTNYLGGFANGSGVINGATAKMVWGIVVDTAGDGFAGANVGAGYMNGTSLAATAAGYQLSTSGGTTNDYLYINASVMASNVSAVDGSAIGDNRLLTFSSFAYNSPVAAGQRYAIIWFDQTTLGGTGAAGEKYGIYELPATALSFGAANVLPADPGSYIFAPASAGADVTKTMSYALVPETSTALLGALGALTLLRRRR